MSARDWRQARETMERDKSRTLQRAGVPEREANKIAKERAAKACERGINIHNAKEGGRPPEL